MKLALACAGPRTAARRGAATAQGFTLVEVLVALTIVAVTLGAGLKAAGAVTGNAQRLADVVAAQWCADNALANLRLGGVGSFPGIGESEFTCEQIGRDYNGKLVARSTPNPNFRRVDAVVSDGDGHQLVSLSTVIGRF